MYQTVLAKYLDLSVGSDSIGTHVLVLWLGFGTLSDTAWAL